MRYDATIGPTPKMLVTVVFAAITALVIRCSRSCNARSCWCTSSRNSAASSLRSMATASTGRILRSSIEARFADRFLDSPPQQARITPHATGKALGFGPHSVDDAFVPTGAAVDGDRHEPRAAAHDGVTQRSLPNEHRADRSCHCGPR